MWSKSVLKLIFSFCLATAVSEASWAQQTVFVTSDGANTSSPNKGAYFGDVTVTGADAFCQAAAEEAVLPRASEFRAWLSTPDEDAKDHIPQGDGPFVLVNGTQVAADLDALLGGNLEVPISLDAGGIDQTSIPPPPVWTGTKTDGMVGTATCDSWTQTSGQGVFGLLTEKNSFWTNAPGDAPCVAVHRLYCFGPAPEPVPADGPMGRGALLILLAIGTATVTLGQRNRTRV